MWIFLNENVWISIKISLKFVPKGQIDNIPALVQIMAWHRPGDKPLSEPMMVSLLTHICIMRPQLVKVLTCCGLVTPHGDEVMACCLTAPSHWLNQSWLIIKGVLWHSHESNFIKTQTSWTCHVFRDNTCNIVTPSPRGQWVKQLIIYKTQI